MNKFGVLLVDDERGRFYQTPAGDMTSITTILKKTSSTAFELDMWRDGVGHKKADAVSSIATNRGKIIHGYAEAYLRGDDVTPMPEHTKLWTQFRPMLDRISGVLESETAMYSRLLGVAGTVDCIGKFDGELAIIDFKTSKRQRGIVDHFDYFLQETYYAIAYKELTGTMATKIVTILTTDYGINYYVKDAKDYIKPLCKRLYKGGIRTNTVLRYCKSD